MSLIQRNDEQIQVGVTTGLVAGSSSFVFDGTAGKPDYRFYEPVFTEISGTNILIKDVEYSWDYITGTFQLLELGAVFANLQWYNVHFQAIRGLIPVTAGLLIDYQFFILDINLPNISPTSTTNKILERLNKAIERYEPECLNMVLGYPLYKLLINETSSRMTELITGAEYINNCGNTVYWKGLVYGQFFSLIADYIYFRYSDFSAAQTTGVSTAAMKTESATSISPDEKMVRAWNLFSKETRELHSFLWSKKIDGIMVYPEFTQQQYSESKNLSRPTNAFGF